jgi:hypothetical protein
LVPQIERWAEALRECAVAIQAVDGYLTIADGGIGDSTSYEHQLRRSPDKGTRDIDRLVRGFFWGNVLSDKHLRQLGGIQAVISNAPVAVVSDLSTEGHQLVYLQLTNDLFSVTEHDEQALQAFLSPILPSPVPPTSQARELPSYMLAPPNLSQTRKSISRPEDVVRSHDSPDVVFIAEFGRPLEATWRSKLDELLDAWYAVGAAGGYGAWLHNLSSPVYADNNQRAEWQCDLGDTDALAIDVLARLLIALDEDGQIALESLRIANKDEAQSARGGQ